MSVRGVLVIPNLHPQLNTLTLPARIRSRGVTDDILLILGQFSV